MENLRLSGAWSLSTIGKERHESSEVETMVREINDCCDCAVPGYPCMGDSCPRRHTIAYECDRCDCECDILYDYDGNQLCKDCLLEVVPKIGG